jgi:beta-mannosidase
MLLQYGIWQSNDNSEVVVLNAGWEFSQAGTELWRPAQVPAPFIRILSIINKFPILFTVSMNRRFSGWENEDWSTDCFYSYSRAMKRDDAQLVFEGLDTYADVYLNGALLLKADNMFVGYTIPVKSQLRLGENLLHIYFHSPIRQTMPQYNSNGFNYPADNDHHEKHVSVFSVNPLQFGLGLGIPHVN